MPKTLSTRPKRARVAKPKDDNLYEASITISGRMFKSAGETIRDAILGLNIGTARGVGVLVLKHGDKSRDKILNAIQITRIFHTRGTTQEINLKNISNLFEGI